MVVVETPQGTPKIRRDADNLAQTRRVFFPTMDELELKDRLWEAHL